MRFKFAESGERFNCEVCQSLGFFRIPCRTVFIFSLLFIRVTVTKSRVATLCCHAANHAFILHKQLTTRSNF